MTVRYLIAADCISIPTGAKVRSKASDSGVRNVVPGQEVPERRIDSLNARVEHVLDHIVGNRIALLIVDEDAVIWVMKIIVDAGFAATVPPSDDLVVDDAV